MPYTYSKQYSLKANKQNFPYLNCLSLTSWSFSLLICSLKTVTETLPHTRHANHKHLHMQMDSGLFILEKWTGNKNSKFPYLCDSFKWTKPSSRSWFMLTSRDASSAWNFKVLLDVLTLIGKEMQSPPNTITSIAYFSWMSLKVRLCMLASSCAFLCSRNTVSTYHRHQMVITFFKQLAATC